MSVLEELQVPLVQAPMAGGPSVPALAAAVARAGGLGFLAGGYKTVSALQAEIAELRGHGAAVFGVNLFVPAPVPDGAVSAAAAYRAELRQEAERYGVELPDPDPLDRDLWEEKLRLLLDDPVPVVSFTFGVADEPAVRALRQAGTLVVGTVTSADEARLAASRGVDVLCVQGPEAGGHRGVFDPAAEPGTTPLVPLLREIAAAVPLPLIASGGLATGADVATALRAGAVAAQLGTAYLRTPEAGTHPAHKSALVDPAFPTTDLTRAFSGRWARGLRNRFVIDHPSAPAAYPMVNQLTRPLRAAAATAADPDGLSLWAGLRHRLAEDRPAQELTRHLWDEARQHLADGA